VLDCRFDQKEEADTDRAHQEFTEFLQQQSKDFDRMRETMMSCWDTELKIQKCARETVWSPWRNIVLLFSLRILVLVSQC
jgi:hypothetical protein